MKVTAAVYQGLRGRNKGDGFHHADATCSRMRGPQHLRRVQTPAECRSEPHNLSRCPQCWEGKGYVGPYDVEWPEGA